MIESALPSSLVLGVVVIGRNEGERLRQCLHSLVGQANRVVYVDSGSTDDSVAFAEGLGVAVVSLDMTKPFTAARARNAGFSLMKSLQPELEYVQFVDGDCEVVPGWLKQAVDFLTEHAAVAVVCGRRRERYPERSVYNRLCDLEWDTPVGQAKSCGGDAMMRVSAFEQVQGYRDDLIAGEEPELCVRLRAAGYQVWRLNAEMTLHDAAITGFGQWWLRTMRGGYAFAQGTWLHGELLERYCVRESRRSWMWGAVLPLMALGAMGFWGVQGLAVLLVYPMQVVRLGLRGGNHAWLQALFLVLGKFPEMLGQIRFWWHHLAGHHGGLIEYK